MSLLSRVYKGRIDCLRDREEPRDLLVSASVKHEFLRELESPITGQILPDGELIVMGMRVEWVRPRGTILSIRTVKGDVRRITGGDSSHDINDEHS